MKSTTTLCTSTLILISLVSGGCVAVPRIRHVLSRPSRTVDAKDTILVIQSATNELFEEPLRVFLEQVPHRIEVVSLLPESPILAAKRVIDSTKPRLIFTMGALATSAAVEATRDNGLPILFAMVPNYTVHAWATSDRVMGVALEAPALGDFTQLKMVFPSICRVLTFYSEESESFLRAARRELLPWGIDLRMVHVAAADQLADAYDTHVHGERIDAIWLQVDSVVMNAGSFQVLLRKSVQDRIPLVASLSSSFAHAGALASIAIDWSAVGSQAANIARQHLELRTPPAQIGVATPVGRRLTVNMATAKRLGLEVPDEAITLVYELVGAE